MSFAEQRPAEPVLKVAVMSDGRITVDGAPATVELLRESLKKLSRQKGVVWYYRASVNTEGPPVVKQVMQAIIDARLPIRFSSQADYSDAISPDEKPMKQ